MTLVPPTGFAISANAYHSDGTFDTYGQANTTDHPENADKEVSFIADGYEYFRVTVGRFTDASAETKAVDPSFISTIGIYLIKPAFKAEDTVPVYWENHIKSKTQALIQSDTPILGSGSRFIFITDTHLRGPDGTLLTL